jgi:hypothetical protein
LFFLLDLLDKLPPTYAGAPGSVERRRSIISVRSHHLALDQVAPSQLPLALDQLAQINRFVIARYSSRLM